MFAKIFKKLQSFIYILNFIPISLQGLSYSGIVSYIYTLLFWNSSKNKNLKKYFSPALVPCGCTFLIRIPEAIIWIIINSLSGVQFISPLKIRSRKLEVGNGATVRILELTGELTGTLLKPTQELKMHSSLELYPLRYISKPSYIKCSAVVNIHNDDFEASK